MDRIIIIIIISLKCISNLKQKTVFLNIIVCECDISLVLLLLLLLIRIVFLLEMSPGFKTARIIDHTRNKKTFKIWHLQHHGSDNVHISVFFDIVLDSSYVEKMPVVKRPKLDVATLDSSYQHR